MGERIKAREAFRAAGAEAASFFRGTRWVTLPVMAVFIREQVTEPLAAVSRMMGEPLSAVEPFLAVTGSGTVLLVLPALFLVLASDLPGEEAGGLFVRVRMGRRSWAAGEMLVSAAFSAAAVGFIFIVSTLLSLPFTALMTGYSHALTGYTAAFPERSGDYAASLLPEAVYQQLAPVPAAFLTALLLFLSFLFLSHLMLAFALAGRKTAGVVLAAALTAAGAVLVELKAGFMWLLPLPHAVLSLHFSGYMRDPVFPPAGSVLYLGGLCLIAGAVCMHFSKTYEGGRHD